MSRAYQETWLNAPRVPVIRIFGQGHCKASRSRYGAREDRRMGRAHARSYQRILRQRDDARSISPDW